MHPLAGLLALLVLEAAACQGATKAPAAPAAFGPVLIGDDVPALSNCGPGDARAGRAVEPSLAASGDGRILVAAWQQDRRRSGGALAIQAAVSRDGGRHWKSAYLPHQGACTGGGFTAASDPATAVTAAGRALVTSLLLRSTASSFDTEVALSGSSDGGASWSDPAPIAVASSPGPVFDKPSLAADSSRPERLLTSWIEYDDPEGRFVNANGEDVTKNRARAALSNDAGARWTAPATIYESPAGHEVQFPQAARVGAGWTAVLAEGDPSLGEAQSSAILRTAQITTGDAWRPTPDAARLPVTGVSVAGTPLRFASWCFTFTARGALYAGWATDADGRGTVIHVVRSDDEGRSWTETASNRASGDDAILPTLSVDGRGRVLLLWYAVAAGPNGGLHVKPEAAESSDRGRSWNRLDLRADFDLPRGDGFFVGDYIGLAGLPAGFAVAYPVAVATGTRIAFRVIP